ncbi:MAG: hypothetical protein ABH864_07230 [archaeon]
MTNEIRERRIEQKDMDQLREAFMKHDATRCNSLLERMRRATNTSDFDLEKTFLDCYADKRSKVKDYTIEVKRMNVAERDYARALFEGEDKVNGRETRESCLKVLKSEQFGLERAKFLRQFHKYAETVANSVAEFFYAGSDVARLWKEDRDLGVLKPHYYKFSSGPPLVSELRELDNAIAGTFKIIMQRVDRLYGGFLNHCVPFLGFEGDDKEARRQIEINQSEYGSLMPERLFFHLEE